ncbi:MAG: T9SS type A sorting domain-containing protein [Bacteroidetes bacterium]|nr:T9SS type A sorting domain-containing protein [Bacteroidota bacterium]
MRYKNIFSALIFSLLIYDANATVYTVINTNDSGAGSLRAAISNVNIFPGTHTIAFNIPLSDPNYIASQGVWKITPTSTLPIITRNNVTIDGTTQTTNQGNTNPSGPEILIDGNHLFGSDFAFHLYNVSGATIKSFIIGRFTVGIEISGTSHNNTIVGNYVGCNFNATDTLSNTHGIELLSGPYQNIIGGATVSERNVFSGNDHVGIRLVNANSNIIKGNYVGLNRTGNAAVRNYDGISIEGTSKYNLIGGYTAAERNYVSGNVAYGIPVFGTGCNYNIIVGNFVGTDITGIDSIPNTYGVLFDDGASYNRLGGSVAGAGNLLSGNSGYGVFLYNPGTQKDTVIGNLIGTDISGTQPLPNSNGIVIDGPSFKHYVDSNVVSGNRQNGIDIHLAGTDSNIVVHNKIGTDITGTQPLGNALDGIRIGEGPHYSMIGGAGKGNVIAYNGGNGITVMTAAELYNTFSENSIYNNAGLGIDLFPAGPTPNDVGDGDSGPNDFMNFPVIQFVNLDYFSGISTVTGTVDNTVFGGANGIKIELFKAVVDASGYGQGKDYFGTAIANAAGNWSFSCSCLTGADFITATATDLLGNTSEFSLNTNITVDINDIAKNDGIKLYPNPANDNLIVEFTDAKFLNTEYIIVNMLGEVVKTGIIEEMKNRIPVENLPGGIYYLQLNNKNDRSILKIVKR